MKSQPSGLAQRERARSRALESDLRLLIPIARRLSMRAPLICVEDCRLAFENAGMLLAYSDRAFASRVYGQLMHRAGLKPIAGKYRRTTRVKSRGGNLVQLWARRAA